MSGAKASYLKGTFGPRRFGEHKLHSKLKKNASADLRAGDILIAKEWSPHNKESLVIPVSQMLLSMHGGASMASEHVLMVLDDGDARVAEAVGGGVRISRGVKKRDHVVYSCADDTLRKEAVHVAERLGGLGAGELNNMWAYSKGNSPVQYRSRLGMSSVLFRSKRKGSRARARIQRLYDYVYGNGELGNARMVCSELVVACYQVAGEKLGSPIFNVDSQAISAKALEGIIMRHPGFKLAGTYVGTSN